MININELKLLVEFIANKHQSGASMSPADFNVAVQSSLDDVILYYYGLPQKYAPGAPMPPVAWEVTQLVTDYLSTLKVETDLSINAEGKATVPTDYLHHSSMCYRYAIPGVINELSPTDDACDTTQNGTVAGNVIQPDMMDVPVVVVDDMRWCSLIASQIRKPTKRYPIAKYQNGYIQFAPKDLASVELTYLRYPLKPEWGYTVPNSVDPVYNPATSQDIELPAIIKNQLTYSVLTKLGINVREPQLQQFAELMKAQGA